MLLLLDIRREEPSPGDMQMVDWFRHYERRFSVVLTKADQIPRGRWKSASDGIARALGLDKDNPPFIVSVKSKEGIDSIRRLLTQGLMAE
jgi:GTP-binding protein EngB required for normal cell division